MSKTKIENNNLSDNVVTTPNIAPATITDSDLSSDAENLNLSSPQLASSLDLSSKTLTVSYAFFHKPASADSAIPCPLRSLSTWSGATVSGPDPPLVSESPLTLSTILLKGYHRPVEALTRPPAW